MSPGGGSPGPDPRRGELAEELCHLGRSLFARGLTPGRTGNLSARWGDRLLVTPGGTSLGDLRPDALAVTDLDGGHLSGPRPSREAFLHAALYRARPGAGAVAHTHSTHAAALSCLVGLDDDDALPPLTAYAVMRVGRLPRLPYAAPGDPSLGPRAEAAAREHPALLLSNHGPVAAGEDLASAVDVVEEVEETARLFVLLGDRPHRLAPRP